MKVTFSRPPTAQVPAAPPPVATSPPRPPAGPTTPRRPSPSAILVTTVALLVVALAIAVAWMWSLLVEGTCPGVVGGETITLRAPARGRVTAIHAAIQGRVAPGDRLVTVTLPDDAEELVRLRERRADEEALVARLTAIPRSAPPAPPVDAPAPTTTYDAEIAALTAEVQAAMADAAVREDVRSRMELLVRLDAALPEDAATATREARLARARADTLAARLAGLQAAGTRPAVSQTGITPPTEIPAERTAPAPAADPLAAAHARIAAIDAAIARLAVRTVTATAAGTIQELPALGGDVAADGTLVVLATGRLWLDVHLPAERGGLAARVRHARIQGLPQDLPLSPGAWRQQTVPPALQFRIHAATTLGQRIDLPPGAPFMPGAIVDLSLR